MKILVAYGSERGGTAGIAEQIGEALRDAGASADVRPAREVQGLAGYDAVLVGGALYAGVWHEDARRFVIRQAAALRERPVWFFSSGPLDDSASRAAIPPTPSVERLMDHVGASGHATFGGRLLPDARGFIASSMAKKHACDFRDRGRIRAFSARVAQQIEDDLEHPELRAARRPVKPLPFPTLAVALCLAAGISALGGGAALVARPDGSAIGLPLWVLRHSPFHDFLVPGILLLLVIGVGNTWAAYRHAIRDPFAGFVSFASGVALVVWIVVEMIMLRSMHNLQIAYLLLGTAIVAESLHRGRQVLPPMSGAPPAVPHGTRT
jgi:menaquinone-dependent protoporphyrinogen oxidase